MTFVVGVSRWVARAWAGPWMAWSAHALPATVLHHAALRAAEAGEVAAAERLYRRAAFAYQLEGDVEGAVRLRTHRMMRVHATATDPVHREMLGRAIAERLMRSTPADALEHPFVCPAPRAEADELEAMERSA